MNWSYFNVSSKPSVDTSKARNRVTIACEISHYDYLISEGGCPFNLDLGKSKSLRRQPFGFGCPDIIVGEFSAKLTSSVLPVLPTID